MDTDVGRAVAETRAGRIDAFEEVVRACDAELRAYLACRCTSAEAVEEITQETFVLAFEKLSDYDPARGPFIVWLKGFARNLALQHAAMNARRLEKGPALERVLAARARQRAQTDADLRPALLHCLKKLPAGQREFLDLRYERGLRAREIGRELGRTVTWVTTRLQRVRDALRDCIRLFMAGSG